ncbi:MAG: hypothetical protein EA382_18180 [Spirochaetaceae bacterium]|nr:MAG: hypothetical protein EA382_18180 [Spirochaetaceae bacterium]
MMVVDRSGARRQCVLLGLVVILIAGTPVHSVADDVRLSATIRFEPAGERVASFEEFVRQLFVLQLEAIDITVSGRVPARIAVVVGYAIIGETVEFTLSLIDDNDGQVIGVTKGSAPVDLQLDRLLTERLATLFESGQIAVDSIREDEALRAEARASEPQEIAVDQPMRDPPVGDTTARPLPAPVRTDAAGFPRFEAATGGAPVVPAGRASKFFGIGYGGVARVAYRVPLGAGAFGVGLSIAPIRFVRTEPELGAFFRYVVPVTVEARYSYAEGRRVEGFARIGLGASYRASDSSVRVDGLSPVLPCGVGGAGLSVRVAHRTQIVIDVGSTVIINLYRGPDDSVEAETIVAIVPSIQLSRRF